jgi:cytochrome P450
MTSAASGTLQLYPPTVPPSDTALPALQFLFRVVRNPLLTLPKAAYEEPLAIIRARGRLFVWLSDPALVDEVVLERAADLEKTPVEKRVFSTALRDGILTADGKLWRWQRRTMAPMFRHSEILRYIPAMTGGADEQLARWRHSPPGAIQQVDRDMSAITFAIIGRTMLAGGLPAEADIIRRETAQSLSNISWEIAFAMLRIPRWMPHPTFFQLRRSARRLRGAVGSIIARRQARGGDHDDLLSRLLAARDPESGAPMDHDRLVNNLLTLLEAGHETTSRALTWTLYLLARAPEWQNRLREEVLAVANNGPLTADHLPSLRLTQQVLKEAMRLYPPAPFMSRHLMKPLVLRGESIPAGAMIMVSIYAIHRHRRLWTDPDRFDPMRFAPEREATLPRNQFMPFGAGPRICLGAAFAMAEATIVLASLLRGARFEWDGRHEPQPVSRVTLQPQGGMPLRVTMLD